MPNEALNALKEATKGLLYMSESDEPFHTFTWKGGAGSLTTEKVLELSKHKPGTPVEEMPLDEFFKDLTEDQDWHETGEKATVQKYRNLLRAIREHLSNVKVFKVGEVNRDIYIIGKTPAGDWAGIKTTAVET